MNLDKHEIRHALAVPVLLLIFMYLVFCIENFGDYDFKALGIYPRRIQSLFGIITMPFVHSDFEHILTNSPAFLFLSTLIYMKYKHIACKAMITMWILCGFLLWIIGRPSYHIGCSGIIYAMVMFVFFAGVINRQRSMMALSLIVVFLYGGMVWYMFPQNVLPEISWEGHLSGALAGIICALVFCEGRKDDKDNVMPDNDPDFDWRGKDISDGDIL